MYKAKNINIIILHFQGSVSFKTSVFEIKDKNLLTNKFFYGIKKSFFVFNYKPLCVFKHNPLISSHYIIHDYHTRKMLKYE